MINAPNEEEEQAPFVGHGITVRIRNSKHIHRICALVSILLLVALFVIVQLSPSNATIVAASEGEEVVEQEQVGEYEQTGTMAPASPSSSSSSSKLNVKSYSDIPALDLSLIDNMQCIPEVCKQVPKFAMSSNYTLLASFPGSGNTWTRSIIEQGTRLWTGSLYKDYELYTNGFRGEMKPCYRDELSWHSAIKSHYPYFVSSGINPKTTAAIIVLRSPFDAILAEFARKHGTGKDSHRRQVTNRTLTHKFPDFFQENVVRWTKFTEYWLGGRVPEAAFKSKQDGTTSYEYYKLINGKWTPVLVLFYEDFVRRPVETQHRLLAYLKLQLQDKMPLTAWEAVVCTSTHGRKSQTKELRKHEEGEYNVYLDATHKLAKRNAVKLACDRFASVWFKDIWGDCMDPTPQVYRNAVEKSTLLSRFDHIVDFCGNAEDDGDSNIDQDLHEDVEEDIIDIVDDEEDEENNDLKT